MQDVYLAVFISQFPSISTNLKKKKTALIHTPLQSSTPSNKLPATHTLTQAPFPTHAILSPTLSTQSPTTSYLSLSYPISI